MARPPVQRCSLSRISAVLMASALFPAIAAAGEPSSGGALDRCLDARGLVRLTRALGPDGAPVWARVVAHDDGIPTRVAPIEVPAATPGAPDLSAVFGHAAALPADAPTWSIAPPERGDRVCAPLDLPQRDLDAGTRVVASAGLNFAAHAEESGGGDVFVFPKPVQPGAPYGDVATPLGVTLLDYEVELAFVLLSDVDLRALPTRAELLARSAFFVANDVTDREPILRNATLSGPGTGFVEGKGQPGFFPAGPWLVRGTELFDAVAACGASSLRLTLDVDEGDGFRARQDATTESMILDPLELLERIAAEVREHGARSPMPVRRAEGVRDYPLVVEGPDGALGLPAGSVVLLGTPEGVAFRAPSPVGVVTRGLVNLRGPLEQLLHEEQARAAAGGRGGYLEPGDRVRAHIDGLGTQIIRIAEPGAVPPPPDPCTPATEVRRP